MQNVSMRRAGTRLERRQREPRQRYSSAHGTKISNISKIQSAIVCCLSSLMAISLADHAMGEISV
jgi:hypothetical protein